MRLPHRQLARLTVLATVTMLSLVAATQAAQAYSPNPSVRYVSQNAGDCGAIVRQDANAWTVSPDGPNHCFIQSTVSGFADFPRDSNSENLWIDLVQGGNLVGRVIFTASGEKLEVVDSRNDGDTIYVWVGGIGPLSPVGTSDAWDSAVFAVTVPENGSASIKIADNVSGTDVIASSNGAGGTVLPSLRG